MTIDGSAPARAVFAAHRIEQGGTTTRRYWTLDKRAWGDGPWLAEEDKRSWTDPATGLPCLIVRHPTAGHLCGYVGVGPQHPWHGQDWHDHPVASLPVYRGVNFAAPCAADEDEAQGVCHIAEPGTPAHVWWFGFDLAHADDLQPGMRAALRAVLPALHDTDVYAWEIYRTVADAMRACAILAACLAAVAAPEGS